MRNTERLKADAAMLDAWETYIKLVKACPNAKIDALLTDLGKDLRTIRGILAAEAERCTR